MQLHWKNIQRPIYLDDFVGEADAEVVEYSPDKIEVRFKGDFEAEIRIEDGKFNISDDKGYNVNVKSNAGESVLTITPNGYVKPQNGAISVMINGAGKTIENIGVSKLDDTCLKGIDVNQPLTADQLKQFVFETYGHEIELNSEKPTWEEFSKELVGAMGAAGGEILENAGLNVVIENAENSSLTDEQAVKHAADALEVAYEGEALKSDVYLTPHSFHNTTVTWNSSRPDILSNEGVLNRANMDVDTVTLTAEVRRGDALAKRDFVIPLDLNIDDDDAQLSLF